MKNIKWYQIIGWVVFCLLIYFPLFLHLDYLPIHRWDAARLAVNAFEMTKNHNLIVTYFEGEPDLWNLKPPLMIWLQVVFMKIIGYNELAVRLPSALAALFTCFTLVWFSKKIDASPLLGILTVLILISSSGFVGNHISRSGDYDALLVLFTTLYLTNIFLFMEGTSSRKRHHLLIFFAALVGAALTKGVAALLFLPGIFIYVALKNKWSFFFKEKYFYVGIIVFIVFVVGYYALRELLNSGYIAAVLKNELGGRYLDTIELHAHPFSFYFEHIINHDFKHWYLFVPVGIITGLLVKKTSINHLALFTTICVITFLLVISYGRTKLFWYSAPVIPLLAIIVAIFFVNLRNALYSTQFINQYSEKRIIALLPFVLLFISPYIAKVNSIYFEKLSIESLDSYGLPYYLKRELKKENNDISGLKVLYAEYNAAINFYRQVLNENNQSVTYYIHYNPDDYSEQDRVAVSQQSLKPRIENDFEYDIIEQYRTVSVYRIIKRNSSQ